MKKEEVELLAKEGLYQGKPLKRKVEETHISWVILSDEYAFKLKKPIKLSFLNYTSLASRKKFCEKELELNSRYTDIYLAVLPICQTNGKWHMGGEGAEVLEYAVQMKRMDSEKQMDRLLKEDKVTQKDIRSLAKVVTDFHQNAEKLYDPFNIEESKDLFNDMEGIEDYVMAELGEQSGKVINDAISWSNNFLDLYAKRLQERIEAGFKRDLHGDLHSGNIFLYDTPILFDCIEFNDEFRQVDVLYEIAFLEMDLEAYDKNELSDCFLDEYNLHFNVMPKEEDKNIYRYFKCLRANVRAKVHALGAKNFSDLTSKSEHLEEVKKYLTLIRNYIA